VFEASAPVLFCDYFRIPYAVVRGPSRHAAADGWERLSARGGDAAERSLYWPAAPAGQPGWAHVEGIPLFARLADERVVADFLTAGGRRWTELAAVRSGGGEPVASVWRGDDGTIVLPFDPAEAIQGLWSEAYRQPASTSLAGRAKRLAMRGYYRARPLLPRATQIALRRAFSRVQARTSFPRWPVETALHDLYALLFGWLAEVADGPVPWIAPWPRGYAWALVLTHDVETRTGYEHIALLREVESRHGFRSAWNLVPRRYDVADEVVQDLLANGFEVGVHGLYHDGRDVESEQTLRARLPEMRRHAERWSAAGFRSPATHRSWELMPLLGFDYDSSSPDTDPFEPQAGGCCSLLPFFNDGLVELPITLPQDHTLFAILGHADESAWLQKTARIKALGGMALLITHPDYMLEPASVALYERFLTAHRNDPTVWKPLPRDVSAWWRRRAASHVTPDGDGWRVVGPAAGEASVRFSEPVSART
jgi:hypothetical protein